MKVKLILLNGEEFVMRCPVPLEHGSVIRVKRGRDRIFLRVTAVPFAIDAKMKKGNAAKCVEVRMRVERVHKTAWWK